MTQTDHKTYPRKELPVLITGDTGTGKSHLAKTLHINSPRKQHPFLRVLCRDVLPSSVLERELFGIENDSGASSGLVQFGKLEQADGGTLLLDNIDELSLEMQDKLFQFTTRSSFYRINGKNEIFSDVRLVATIRKNPEQLLRTNELHQGFYIRLNQMRIHLLPLSERKNGGQPFFDYLLSRLCNKLQKNIRGFSPDFLHFLKSYHWPGNILQLQNIIERAVILEESLWIKLDSLWFPESQKKGRKGSKKNDSVNQ
ncbi:MAG: sigma 54-interacting transcriptional regulator [Desulfohalobiaceae bacterium]|nr:sigma 54-interacting transcriptional regulator [Desulfohalobiaceae bacterium]